MSIQQELKEFLLEKGVSDVGFFSADDGDLPFGISIAVRLSESIVNEIADEPTHTYFNHYRSVNAFIDSMLLQAGCYVPDFQRRRSRCLQLHKTHDSSYRSESTPMFDMYCMSTKMK